MSRRDRRGANAVEFGLVITVLLSLLLGMVDWALYMVRWMDVDVAVSRGARIAAGLAEDPEGSAAQAVCDSLLARNLACDASDVEVRKEADASGQVVVVHFEMPYDPPVGLVPTPPLVQKTATTNWYGWLYEED